jgi:hypothetical protein
MHKVPTDSSKDGKLSYMNLKCVIWHVAFLKLVLPRVWLLTGFTFTVSEPASSQLPDLKLEYYNYIYTILCLMSNSKNGTKH